MRSSFMKAAAEIGAAAALSYSSVCAASEPGATDSRTKVEALIDALPSRAVPTYFRGRHSSNLNHLNEERASSAPSMPVVSPISQSAEYFEELKALKKACPGLPNTKDFNAADWVLKNLDTQNASTAPRALIDAAYFSVARMNPDKQQMQALTFLNLHSPDSPEFLIYMEKKREELHNRLNAISDLAFGNETWTGKTDKQKEMILARILGETLVTLLPGKQIEMPRIFYLRGVMNSNDNGFYDSEFNELYINGDLDSIGKNYDFAREVTIHETFHAFEFMLAEWVARKKIKDTQLQRQARYFMLGNVVDARDDYYGYRTGFSERAAWSFELAARPHNDRNAVSTDMFLDRTKPIPFKIASVPFYKTNPKEGVLPAACLKIAS